MRALIVSSICTSAIFLGHRILKVSAPLYFYIATFFLIFSFMFVNFSANAEEFNINDYILEKSDYCENINYRDHLLSYDKFERYKISQVIIAKGLSEKQRKKYTNKRDFELREAKRCEKNLVDKSYWIPCMDDRAKTRAALKASGIAIAALKSKPAAIGMFLDILGDYVFSCVDEWYYIRDQSNWCQSHYEMYQWYQNVLDNA